MPDEPPPAVVAAAEKAMRAVFEERTRRGVLSPPQAFTLADAIRTAAVALVPVWPVAGSQPSAPTAEATPAERIYSAYPRKVARKNAMKAIANALAAVPFEKLLAATTAYAEAVERWTADERARFIPHPATWFNRESYLDDPKAWERKPVRNGATDYTKI